MLRRELVKWIVALPTSAASADNANSADNADNADSADDRDRRETALVDRIEDGRAVVVFEEQDRQETVRAPILPPPAREEGSVIHVPDGDAFALAEFDRAATRERRRDARDRFDDLAEPESDA